MSTSVLVIGESGTGKSTSIRTLPPEETFILSVLGKSLPFRGANKNYTKLSPDGLTGNYYASDDHARIVKVIKTINEKRPDIKYFVIDDFGYSITKNFMNKALERGYDKFSNLAKDAWDILCLVTNMRDDLITFVMMHSDVDQQGKSKPKTIGKMLDERVCVEGMFAICLETMCDDMNYGFLTNNTGASIAKSPIGMFKELTIENDLKLVADHINAYLNDEVQA